MTSPLHRPNFRWFFAGRLVSLLGSSMAPVALAFAILDASHRTADLGIVLAARMIPLLALLLVGGAVADRFPRRTVLLVANLGAGATQATVAVILLTGRYQLLLVVVLEFLNGALDAFTGPALRGVLPELVPQDQLRKANSLLSSTRNATKILGPTAAALIVAGAGSGTAIAFDALTFLLAAAFLTPIRLPGRVRGTSSTLLLDIRTGWHEFRTRQWVWAVVLSSALMNLFQTGTWQVLGPQLTRQTSGATAWGLVLSARGLGLLLMSTLMYRLVFRHLLRAGQLASVLGALPLLALGWHAHAPWLIAAALVAGLGSSLSAISWDTSLQEHVPPDKLSRLSSYDDLLSFAVIPLGQLTVGPLAGRFGGFAVAGCAGALYAVAAVASLLSRQVRDLPHTAARSTETTPA
ncbi:MFS transporter [Actinoplanes sp. N902-109]|uniref:MFS transporter n=1 Tax=Actinoplanes sp. (strain N902-109) TaxID=649831 RepID=UPI0003295E52|nr:MFS transporter [Actinoplanes sp. N902-109]AGL19005.1 major facilitator superfamily MFS_1 [Actinoplanes sp. N902-109]